MPLLRSFHLSTYLTLGMAVLCLGYSEVGLLSEAPYITGFVLILIAVAYRIEGRWSLSLQAANVVGGGLTLLLIAWVAFQFLRGSSEIQNRLPFPTLLLPFLGPVLMILVPAKLFRPKHVGDFWAMQGVGLLAVSLGCAMANDLLFGAMLIVYLFCFVWSLALFYLYREIRPRGSAGHDGSSRLLYLFRVTRRWSTGIVAAALLLFLLTPRPTDGKWELPMSGRGRMEVGLSDGGLDLNKTGSLEQNKELAFIVQAQDAEGNSKADLNLDQRWRVGVRTQYENGRWPPDRGFGLRQLGRTIPMRPIAFSRDDFEKPAFRNAHLPDFGPRTYYLYYTLHPNSGIVHPLSDPVMWRPNDLPPVLAASSQKGAVLQKEDGSFDWSSQVSTGLSNYCQATVAASEPDLGPPMQVAPGYQDFLTRIPRQQLAERMRGLSAELFERLVGRGKLPRHVLTELDQFTGKSLPKYHETISRALSAYLAQSGEFKYSLELVRKDRSLDPIEDFLFNTKAGHCQRFATALVLMLRSQGIPAQMVVGYRGCESVGEGKYEVRQYHAHAWVEVLVQRSAAANTIPRSFNQRPPAPGDIAYHWLSLDPTPDGEPISEKNGDLTDWLGSTFAKGESFFRKFILGYDANARENAAEAISNGLEEFAESVRKGEITWPAAIVGGFVLVGPAIVVFRRVCRRRRRIREEAIARETSEVLAPFHGRLLDLLAKHGYEPRPGQTAMEFTAQVAEKIANDSAAASVANVPIRLADAYYRVRFGGQKLTEQERQELDDALRRLETILDGTPRTVVASSMGS